MDWPVAPIQALRTRARQPPRRRSKDISFCDPLSRSWRDVCFRFASLSPSKGLRNTVGFARRPTITIEEVALSLGGSSPADAPATRLVSYIFSRIELGKRNSSLETSSTNRKSEREQSNRADRQRSMPCFFRHRKRPRRFEQLTLSPAAAAPPQRSDKARDITWPYASWLTIEISKPLAAVPAYHHP
jgi:hypothetical protein